MLRSGQRYGRLVILECLYDEPKKSNTFMWSCACDCGNVAKVAGANLSSGATRSCGCITRVSKEEKEDEP